MKTIQTEQEIENNFLLKRAKCIAAQAEIDAATARKNEADRIAAANTLNSQEQQIRALYNSYVESMVGKYMETLPIEIWYSNYKALVLSQSW